MVMAKVPFSKLNVKRNEEVISIVWNEMTVEVLKYLPMKDKAEMISRIINLSVTDAGFYNPLQIEVLLTLEILYNYTNISFTEKQKEDVYKLYDSVISSGLFAAVKDSIPANEFDGIQTTVWHTIDKIYEYKSSILGLLEAVSQDYSNTALDLKDIQNVLSDPDSLGLLKQILPLLNNEPIMD